MKKFDRVILLFLTLGVWTLVITQFFSSGISFADRHHLDEILLGVSDSCKVEIPEASELPTTASVNCF